MVNDIEKTCPSCCEFYYVPFTSCKVKKNLPLFLPCGHTMCETCIVQIMMCMEPVGCMVCQREAEVETTNRRELTENKSKLYQKFPVNVTMVGELVMQQVKTLDTTEKKTEEDSFIDLKALLKNDVQGMCAECNATSSRMCKQCVVVLCDNCFNKTHKSYMIFKNHLLQNIEFCVLPTTCKAHTRNPLEYYCKDCKKSVCKDCMILGGAKSCKNHDVVSLQEVNEHILEDVTNIVPQVDETFRRLTKTAVDIGYLLHNYDNDTESVKELSKTIATVEQHFSKLFSVVQKNKDEIMDIISYLKCSHKNSLQKARSEVENAIKKANNVLRMLIAVTDTNNIKQMNLPALLEEAKAVTNTAWYLNKIERNHESLKVSVNEDLCALMSDYVHMEGNVNSLYKLNATSELGDDVEVPPAPTSLVYPPVMRKDVQEYDVSVQKLKEEKVNKKIAPVLFMEVPTYHRKSASVSSQISDFSEMSNMYQQQVAFQNYQPELAVQNYQPEVAEQLFAPNQYPQQLCEVPFIEVPAYHRKSASVSSPISDFSEMSNMCQQQVAFQNYQPELAVQNYQPEVAEQLFAPNQYPQQLCEDVREYDVSVQKIKEKKVSKKKAPVPFMEVPTYHRKSASVSSPISDFSEMSNMYQQQVAFQNYQPELAVQNYQPEVAEQLFAPNQYPQQLCEDVREYDVSVQKLKEEKVNKKKAPGLFLEVPKYHRKSASVTSQNSDLSEISSIYQPEVAVQKYQPEVAVQLVAPNQHPQQLCEGSQELIYITHIVDPNNFFMQQAGSEKLVKDIIQKYRDAAAFPTPHPEEIAPGSEYLAFNNGDNMWQRCRVLSVDGEGCDKKIEVFCYDFGCIEFVYVNWLRVLPSSGSGSLISPLAIFCSLYNCEPKTGQWTVSDSQLMRKIIEDKQVKMHIRRITNTSNKDFKLECDIYTFEQGISLAHALVFHGRANLTNLRLKHLKNMGSKEKFQVYVSEQYYKVGKRELVYITHVVSADEFYVRKESHQELYEKLTEDLEIGYSLADKSGAVYLPEIGTVCAVNLENCPGAPTVMWARGVVVEHKERACVLVQLPDSGHIVQVHWTRLRYISSEKFIRLSALATKVHLTGLAPYRNKWGPASIEYLQQYVGRLLELQVEDNREKYCSQGSVGITLYDRTDNGHICINDEMVKYNLAASIA